MFIFSGNIARSDHFQYGRMGQHGVVAATPSRHALAPASQSSPTPYRLLVPWTQVSLLFNILHTLLVYEHPVRDPGLAPIDVRIFHFCGLGVLTLASRAVAELGGAKV